jgi:flagellar assembly protein FliH
MNSSTDLRPLESLVRGQQARDATPAAFNVDLRRLEEVPSGMTKRVRDVARATGYAEGWSQGHCAALGTARAIHEQHAASARLAERHRDASLRRAIDAVANAATALERHTAVDVSLLEDLVLRTALQIAELILGEHLTTSADPGREALHRAMDLVPPDGPVTVRLNPDDYYVLTGSHAPEYEQVHEGRHVTVLPDPGLQSGDATAHCAATTVDARLASAVERVRVALRA